MAPELLSSMNRVNQLSHFRVVEHLTGKERVVICAARAASSAHAALRKMFPEAEPFTTLVDSINRQSFSAWRNRDGLRIFSWTLIPPVAEVTVEWVGTRDWDVRYAGDQRRPLARFQYKSQVMAYVNENNLLIVHQPKGRHPSGVTTR